MALEPGDAHELTIRISDQGCQVEGPIQDKLLCYGMLELARDAIATYNKNVEEGKRPNGPLVVAPPPGLRLT